MEKTFLAVFFALLLLAGGAGADPGNGVVVNAEGDGRVGVEYGEDVVWLTPPEGYCALDVSQEWDRMHLEQALRPYGKAGNTFLARFMDCDALRQGRASGELVPVRYVDVIVFSDKAGFLKFPRKILLQMMRFHGESNLEEINENVINWQRRQGGAVDADTLVVGMVGMMKDFRRLVSHFAMRHDGMKHQLMVSSLVPIGQVACQLYHYFPHTTHGQWWDRITLIDHYVTRLRTANNVGRDGSALLAR